MGVVEDAGKITQDFLAPELGGLKERLLAVEQAVAKFEKNVDQRFTDLHNHLDKRFDGLERSLLIAERLSVVEEKLKERTAS
jgi:hypothetical protein